MGKVCYFYSYFIPELKFTFFLSRAILSYLVSAYGKDDSLYPTDVRTRALVDQRMQFDLGTLYLRMTEYYVNLKLR